MAGGDDRSGGGYRRPAANRRAARLVPLILLTACSLLSSGLLSCSARAVEGPQVFAAASMAPVVAEVLSRSEIEARVQPAASSTLANQILHGAPASVFVSAHASWMDEIEAAGLLQLGTRRVFAGNQLVLVAPKGERDPHAFGGWADLARSFEGRLSIGDPDLVPAGRYAQQALQALGLWEQLKGRLAPAIDARAALAAIELGALQLGVVYRSDALASERVEIVAAFPERARPEIRYELALLVGAPQSALPVYRALIGEPGQQVLAEKGFTVLVR